ncbi:MAG: hypothetical protein EXQ85_04685 [Alphaproteobacteria bacterium]|nr:hypothetical protein [Alphaproteobacteria bacterium]
MFGQWTAHLVRRSGDGKVDRRPAGERERRQAAVARPHGGGTRTKPIPKSIGDDDCLRLAAKLAHTPPTGADIATLERRGFEDRDGGALEILGYTYASGWGRAPDYPLAYEYYGLAFILGSAPARANLDKLWPSIPEAVQITLKMQFETAFPNGVPATIAPESEEPPLEADSTPKDSDDP